MYWDCDHFVGSIGIQKIFAKTTHQEDFVDNARQGKTDKHYENTPIIDHLNEPFQIVFSNEPEHSIDKHMANFKGHSCFLS